MRTVTIRLAPYGVVLGNVIAAVPVDGGYHDGHTIHPTERCTVIRRRDIRDGETWPSERAHASVARMVARALSPVRHDPFAGFDGDDYGDPPDAALTA